MKIAFYLLSFLFITTDIFPQSDWKLLSSGTKQRLTGVCFTDINNGIVVGDYTIIRTTNSGRNWNDSRDSSLGNYFESEFYADVDYTAPNNFIVIAYWMWCGYLYRTTDGGKSWIFSDYKDEADELFSVSFGDDSTGILVGDWGQVGGYYGLIYRTTNGGENWTRQDSANINIFLDDVYMINNYTGIIVGVDNTNT